MTSAQVEALVLERGQHAQRSDGMCFAEAVAFLAGEPHSDAPLCMARPVRSFAITTNDWANDEERQQLKPYLLRAIGTATVGQEADQRATFMLVDWVVRDLAPLVLESQERTADATSLMALAPIVDRATALKGEDAAYAVAVAAPFPICATASYAAAAAGAATVPYSASLARARVAAAYAAACVEGETVTRSRLLAMRLAVLDRILREAYQK